MNLKGRYPGARYPKDAARMFPTQARPEFRRERRLSDGHCVPLVEARSSHRPEDKDRWPAGRKGVRPRS